MAIARAIVADPQVLVADEPTGDLDGKSAHEDSGPAGEPQSAVREDDRDGHPRSAGAERPAASSPRERRPRRPRPPLRLRAHEVLPFILKHLRHNWVRTRARPSRWSCASSCSARCRRSSLRSLGAAERQRLAPRRPQRDQPLLLAASHLQGQGPAVPGVRNVAKPASGCSRSATPPISSSTPCTRSTPRIPRDLPEYILSTERSGPSSPIAGAASRPDTAREFRWQKGDAIRLEDRTANLPPFDFVVSGIYEVDDVRHPGTDARILFFHHRYLEEISEHRVGAGFLVVEVEDPGRAGAVAAAIDQMFEDSERQTHTATESAFRAGMVSMAGDLTRSPGRRARGPRSSSSPRTR